ncbi:PHD finger domain protein [Aspergillus lucknowensis]|uniref:PHD-type domain-containing protein n=1 Tax=Aspergillus lucknowensis TaxID=176173 RepID=A0ABR4M5D1_9EURO
MSWDQPIHSFSYPNGEPQTPTRTPPTTFFGDAAFQTPKLESSFFDPRVTWDTSDPYASSPEFLRTPQRLSLNTPRLPNQKSTQDPETSGLHNAKPLDPQVETARKRHPSKLQGSGEDGEDGSRTVESTKSAASMQTPPPSSASRTKVTEFGALSSTGRRLSASSLVGVHLETPSRVMGTSPRLFGALQSSPDPFQLGTIDPSGSPFFPQQRLFWDHELNQHSQELGLPGNDNRSLGPTNTAAFHTNTTDPPQDLHIPQLPQVEGDLDIPEFNSTIYGVPSGGPTDAALFPAPFSTSPRLPIPKADDPGLFLSSPARRFGGPQPTPEKRLFSRQHRQPYHHQTEEFKREELRRSQGINPHLSEYEEEDDDYTPRQTRPTLTRSLTVNAVTASRPGSGGTMSSASGIRKSPSKGRSSPIKPNHPPLHRSNSVAVGFPRRSQSVVLKIGKDGRAKTEMQPVLEGSTGLTAPVKGMDLDSSATESEYDPAEFPGYQTASSRNPSFAFSEVGKPTVSRKDSGSRPPSMGSYTSSHSDRASPWASAPRGPARRPQLKAMDDWKRTPTRQSAVLNSDLSYSSSASIPGLAETEEDTGGAQHALRKVLEDKGRLPRSQTVASFGSRSNRPLQPLAQLQSSPPRFGTELDSDSREPNTSPTTITDPDLATPSTDRYSNPSNGTRCICNSMDNGGHLMIQCESCSHWLHTKCVGLERSNLPSIYVCVFCAQTPTRKNRISAPVSGVGHAPTSPLAHKSYRFR